MSSKKVVVLRSSDGVSFELEEEAALLSQTIKDGMEDGWVEGGLPLPTINSQTLSLVIDYCKKHAAASASSEALDSWDADFVKVEHKTLFDIILAANYLNIRGLLDLACQTVADMIKGKTPDEIRQIFNINSVFTPEEEEELPVGCLCPPEERLAVFRLVCSSTQAANYLNIKGLLDLTRQTVAATIRGKTSAEILEFFNTKNNFMAKEVMRENESAFDRRVLTPGLSCTFCAQSS
ncbi:hypothetical protein MLD38_024827 [Melastoma candidum]|uniref:Uncharacterized protein n=1 Tax=Melastoma candidum TaxID=119954 RepID=A0ACB9NTF9_9MYRT|nr:hypothetical protein MLD38_024827 [Melastoma candidum]